MLSSSQPRCLDATLCSKLSWGLFNNLLLKQSFPVIYSKAAFIAGFKATVDNLISLLEWEKGEEKGWISQNPLEPLEVCRTVWFTSLPVRGRGVS